MTNKNNKGPRDAAPARNVSGCVLKTLPDRLHLRAAKTAANINPVNAPVFGPESAMIGGFQVLEPQHIAMLTSKYWGPSPRQLTVSFLESTDKSLRAKILQHMNAWNKTACISFVETKSGGEVRISREPGGFWSYLGTDILYIPEDRPTMNLEGFTMATEESEFYRVVRHETGHTLGFPHEHMRQDIVARIDPQKAYDWFYQTQGWNPAMVDAQVLTPLNEASLMSTPADTTSIMCYQLPGDITYDGDPIPGGTDIDDSDYDFASRVYPKRDADRDGDEDTGQVAPAAGNADDWPESDDVTVDVRDYL